MSELTLLNLPLKHSLWLFPTAGKCLRTKQLEASHLLEHITNLLVPCGYHWVSCAGLSRDNYAKVFTMFSSSSSAPYWYIYTEIKYTEMKSSFLQQWKQWSIVLQTISCIQDMRHACLLVNLEYTVWRRYISQEPLNAMCPLMQWRRNWLQIVSLFHPFCEIIFLDRGGDFIRG